jgi:signal transduction histidine kinase
MVTPIRALQAGAARIGAGALDQRIEVRTGDELEALAEEFNDMTRELQELYASLEAKVKDRTRELAQALEEIAEKSRQLEVASRHKSEFLASMSHELRTPLNAIIGFSDVLVERLFGDLTERQERYLGHILTSARHLLSLINDILDLSRVEAGRMTLDPRRFAVRKALEDGLAMITERAARHSIALSLTLDPAVGEIEADERKFRQILFNLLSNAVKFTPDGGRVQVGAEMLDGILRVTVRDNGIGIAAEDQERIFQAFEQAGPRPVREQEGTGLGLSLTKQLVELHGGRIWVESVAGDGSTFTVEIPLRPPVAAASPDGAPAVQEAALHDAPES